MLYGESPLSLGEINLNQYEVLFFEPLHCYLNHISYVLEELPHHITDVDTLVTLKEALSIALKKDKFRCNNYFRVLLQVTILLSGKSDNSQFEFEDGTQKGDHRGCVGCDGDMRNSFDFE